MSAVSFRFLRFLAEVEKQTGFQNEAKSPRNYDGGKLRAFSFKKGKQ